MKRSSKHLILILGVALAFMFNPVFGQQESVTDSTANPSPAVEEQTEAQPKTEAVAEKKTSTEAVKKESQSNPNGFFKNWFFGVKGGATFYLSPLKENPFSWGAAATLGKQLNSKIALRADYLYGNLKSDGHFEQEQPDGSYYKNDLKSNVDFMEIALVMKLSLNDFFYSKSPRYLRELYLFGGGAYTMYRTMITDTTGAFVTGSGYNDKGEKEAMKGAMVVPLGIGVTYKLGKSDIVNLNAEFGYRFVQTDEFNGGLTATASQYTFSSLGLLFNLGRPTLTPQKITADMVREDVKKDVTEMLDKELNVRINKETKPIKEDLAKQASAIAENQNQIALLQEEMEARTNAIKEQIATKPAEGTYGGGGIDVVGVYFAFNSTYITPAMEREIAVFAKVLKKNKNLKCEIVGNSSNVGSPQYNLQLSQKRAEAVYNLLINEFRIDADRLTVVNKGLEEPLAEKTEGINRRVDLIIK